MGPIAGAKERATIHLGTVCALARTLPAPSAESAEKRRPERTCDLTSRMREICKSGSVGAPGGRPPGATRRLYSQGGNRNARFYNAMGSARETMACLHVSVAAAYLEQPEVDADLERIDHVIGALWKLSRRQSR